jgi:hypothetical protein
VFDRLYAYKSQRALPTWEAALEELLDAHQASDNHIARPARER